MNGESDIPINILPESQKILLHKISKTLSGADFYLAGVAVLAEKPINSIDTLLLKECKLREINPEGKEAPQSIKEAVELFYGIKSGDFSER